MPAAIGAVLLGAELAGTALVAGVTLGTVVGSAVLIGGSVALQALLRKPRAGQNGSDADRGRTSQATVNDTISPRRKSYGRVKVGGVRAFWDVVNGQLFQIIMLNHGEIFAFREFWLGDQIVETSGGAAGGDVLTQPFYQPPNIFAFVEAHTGNINQPASQTMLDFWPDVWTAAHQLREIAYCVLVFKGGLPPEEFQNIFPQSYNTPLRCVIDAARVWEPRSVMSFYGTPTSYEWSENPGAIILDFLLSVDGLRKPLGQVDVDSFIGFMDRCDGSVDRSEDGPERRYRCWGGYDFSEDPKDVLQRMLDTCSAELYETNEGKIGIRGGAYAAPVFTLGDADILGCSLSRGNDKLSAYNELRVIFNSLNHDFQPIETDPWIDAAAQAKQGRIAQDFSVSMVPSWTQARRLAKIKMARDNPRWKGTVKANLRGLELLQPQPQKWDLPVFTLQFAALSINEPFVVTGPISLGADDTCTIPVQSIDPASFDWTTAEEGTEPPPPQDTRPIT